MRLIVVFVALPGNLSHGNQGPTRKKPSRRPAILSACSFRLLSFAANLPLDPTAIIKCTQSPLASSRDDAYDTGSHLQHGPRYHPRRSGFQLPSAIECAFAGSRRRFLDQTGWIRVTGSDRVRWLNGMATNSVQDLATSTGAYNFFLNAQGRIQGDGNIFAAADEVFIETSRQQISTLLLYLDHYIIMDDVELADISDARHGLTVLGPQAASLLAQLGIVTEGLNELEIRTLPWNSATLTVIRAHGPFVPRFEVWAERAEDILHLQKLLRQRVPSHATPRN